MGKEKKLDCRQMEAELRELMGRVFSAYDTNNDSKLNLYQLGNLLLDLGKAVTSKPLEEDKVDALMEMVDINKDGLIDHQEYQFLKELVVS